MKREFLPIIFLLVTLLSSCKDPYRRLERELDLSPPASQLKSLGLLSPSTMNVTLKFSPVATRFGASTVRFWAYASLHRSASAAHIIIFLFIIFGYQFFSFSRDFSISAFSLLTLS